MLKKIPKINSQSVVVGLGIIVVMIVTVAFFWSSFSRVNSISVETGRGAAAQIASPGGNLVSPIDSCAISMTATPTAVPVGQSAILTWSINNPTSAGLDCTGFSSGSGTLWKSRETIKTSGSASTGALLTSANYTIECVNLATQQKCYANKQVEVLPPTNCNISLTANPAAVFSGQSATLDWSTSSNTIDVSGLACTGVSSGSGTLWKTQMPIPANGSANTGPLTMGTNYIISCSDLKTQQRCGADFVVDVLTVPTIDISVSPKFIISGSEATLNWTIKNLTAPGASCYGTSEGSGTLWKTKTVLPLTGIETTGSLIAPTTYIIRCIDNMGKELNTARVLVNVTPPPLPKILGFNASTTSVAAGQKVYLSWQTQNVPKGSCWIWGIPETQPASGGSIKTTPVGFAANYSSQTQTSPLYTNTTFNLVCWNGAGETKIASKNISVINKVPVANISAAPNIVARGGVATIYWSAPYADNCWMWRNNPNDPMGSYDNEPIIYFNNKLSASKGGFAGANGTGKTTPLTSSKRYNVACWGPGGDSQASVVINVTDNIVQ